MRSILPFSRALLAGAVAVTTATSVAALPMFAADEKNPAVSGLTDTAYAEKLLMTFERIGARQYPAAYDGRSIDRSPFDFQAYRSHTCFRQIGSDVLLCQELFGPYADLQSVMASGKLRVLLRGWSHLAAAAPFAPAPADESATVIGANDRAISLDDDTASNENMNTEEERLRKRATQLWSLCQRRTSDQETAKRCYQRNIRLTTLRTERIVDSANLK